MAATPPSSFAARSRSTSSVVGTQRHAFPAWANRSASCTDRDRKSTRLNSSHVSTSYAVFCLKKKRTPLVWPTTPIPIRLELGDAGRRLLNGTTSWDDNAASALAEWTAVVPLLVQQADAPNVVRWSDANEHLGSLAATTQKESRVVHGRLAIVRATTILNAALC